MLAPLLTVVLLVSIPDGGEAEADAGIEPAAPFDPLSEATAAFEALDYRSALAATERALGRHGNPREVFLRIHELRGITAAALGDETVATESFRTVLSLFPEHSLPREFSPRIRDLYLAARAEVTERGTLHVAVLPQAEDGRLRVGVVNDPFRLARRFRFHFPGQDGSVLPIGGELVNEIAELEPPSNATGGWWGELLGANDAVLVTLGAPDALLPLPSALLRPKFAAAPEPLSPPPAHPVSATLSRIPKATWGLWAGAGASLVAGGVVGAMSRGSRQQVQSAERDDRGRVVGLSQREAFDLHARAQSQATVANVLFGTAAALLVAGSGVWWWDAQLGEGAR